MCLRTFFPNLLAHFPSLLRFDQLAAEDERDQQRRDGGVSGAKRDLLKNVERLYEIPVLIFEMRVKQLVKKVVNQFRRSSPAGAKRSFNALTTFSVATPRDPFTSTRSPSRTSFTISFAASSDESKNLVCDSPPSLAPATISLARPRTPQSIFTP